MATAQLEDQQLLIGGNWVGANSEGVFEQKDPYTDESVGVVAAASREDAKAAADAAAAAFGEWSATPPGQRRDLLTAAADLLGERGAEIATTATQETGSTFGFGMFNVGLATEMLRQAAAQAYWVTGEVIPSDVPGLTAMGIRQPAGVVVGIAPWNAPVILGTRSVATPWPMATPSCSRLRRTAPARTRRSPARSMTPACLPA